MLAPQQGERRQDVSRKEGKRRAEIPGTLFSRREQVRKKVEYLLGLEVDGTS